MLSGVIGAVVAMVVLAVTGAWPVALIVSLGVSFLPYAWVVSRVAGRTKTVRAAWPEVIDSMVSGVRAGTSLPQVLCDLADEGPAPVRFAFDAFSRDYAAHGRFASALDRMKDEVRDPVADRIVEALRVASAAEGRRPIKDESGEAVNVCPQGHFRVWIVGPISDARQRSQLGACRHAGLR